MHKKLSIIYYYKYLYIGILYRYKHLITFIVLKINVSILKFLPFTLTYNNMISTNNSYALNL